jgi:hydroxymethylbilane synthase
MPKYRVASRPSLLAYTQTEQTVNLLKAKNPDCEFEIVTFTTHGDRVTDKPLTAFGGTGLFVKELENAILEGKADFAVHSLKDVPGIQPDGLVLASFPVREDPRDVLLAVNNELLSELPENCVIGTGSPRRILQLMQQKPNARFADLRGNIDTRIAKLQMGQYNAIVLAAAGLKRIGRTIPENAYLPVNISIPAIGQGTIAIECKKNDGATIKMLRTINHPDTETATMAERAFMIKIGGGCKFPLAAFAQLKLGMVDLQVLIGDHKTGKAIRLNGQAFVNDAEMLGIELADKILEMAKIEGIPI